MKPSEEIYEIVKKRQKEDKYREAYYIYILYAIMDYLDKEYENNNPANYGAVIKEVEFPIKKDGSIDWDNKKIRL